MASAKKCDRCGNFYEEKHRPILNVLNDAYTHPYIVAVDLCPKCVKELKGRKNKMETRTKKIQKKYFYDIINNNKRFEIRKNDCDYQVGDIVKLVLYDDDKQVGTNNYIVVKITYVLKDIPQYGLDKDYCIFGFEICEEKLEK